MKAAQILKSRGSKATKKATAEISPELLAQAIALLQSQTASSLEAAPAKREAKPAATHLSIPLGKQTMLVNLKVGNAWVEGDVEKAIVALRKAFPKATSVHRERKK